MRSNMKVQILHDSAGNIRGIFAPTSGERKGTLLPQGPDGIVTEIDIPEIDLELTPETQEQVVELLDQRISRSKVVSGRLTREDGSK
jgi:hypothetical protein